MGTRQEEGFRRRKIIPEVEPVILQAYQAGASLKMLAQSYACSVRVVRAVLTRHGVLARNRGASPLYSRNQDFVSRVLALNLDGYNHMEISAELGCGFSVVGKILRTHGVYAKEKMRGAGHPNWKGGRAKTPFGYWMVTLPKGHPLGSMRLANGYVLEHRLVMAEHLGRSLTAGETVHHINGDKLDNRFENLQLRTGKHGKHSCFSCGDCGSRNVIPVPIAEKDSHADR